MSVVICIQEFKDRLDAGTIECLFDLRNPE